MSDTPADTPRIHPAALLSCALGVASVGLLLLGLAGLPALLVGLGALRAIHRSEGRDTGRGLAVTGVVLGGVTTLVTVVGVVAVIVIRLQDNARRVGSADHLRQIGDALVVYLDNNKSFPAATRRPEAMVPDRRLSFHADILPMISPTRPVNDAYRELHERIDGSRAWDDGVNRDVAAVRVRALVCPGHYQITPAKGEPWPTSYVGTSGLGIDAAILPRTDANAGVFGHDRGVKPSEATSGISNTTMMIETTDRNGPWLAGGSPTVRGVDPEDATPIGVGRAFGGLHSGLVQVLYMDRSVRAMGENVEPEVLRRLVRLRR